MVDTGEINYMVGFNHLKAGSAFISISKKPSGSALGAFFCRPEAAGRMQSSYSAIPKYQIHSSRHLSCIYMNSNRYF